jgi:dTDP-3-amino-2,3,6-trideoxy-4-keto-D-glucose/dTDP-3-amino-3,4,6-trideoxy-alpha-D-glucose/dTDP-2,6-dideoxy-D-kanosamine transaminase
LRLLLNDLTRHTRALSAEIEAAMGRVLASGWFILGPEVEAFEHEFATYIGTTQAIGVANGTDAIELALRAIGIGPGDRVITVANAGMYSTTAILAIGAVPIYVDVNAETMNMNPDALHPKARAIIVTHLYGRMADMPRIMQIAYSAGIPVIEDCAQAHGAAINGVRAGAWGAAGCFSFYPTKNLGALGDGAAVVTSDMDLAHRIRQLRQYGWTSKYSATLPGGRNSRLDELQAAVLRVKLPHLDKWNQRRRAIAASYSQLLKLPVMAGPDYVAHLYVIRSPVRDSLRTALASRGIACEIHYPIPDYRQEAVRLSFDLPVTESCCREVLTLPCFPEMTDAEVAQVAETVTSAAESKEV